MTLDRPLLDVKNLARQFKRQQGAPYLAECLGDNGQGYSKKYPGYIYVREILSVDPDTGGMTKGETYLVLAHRNFIPSYGVRVWVVYDKRYDEWVVDENDPFSLMEQGINPAILNPNNPWSKFIDTLNIPPALPYAVSNGNTSSTEIAVKNFLYLDYLGVLKLFRLDGTSRPDMADYEPAANTKRLVHFWLDHDNTISATAGTAIDEATPFDAPTHLPELLQDRTNQLSTPLGAFRIANGDTAIGPEHRYRVDTRPWLNTQQYAGFPNPVAYNHIVPSGVKQVVAEKLTVTAKLTVKGKLTIAKTAAPKAPLVLGPVYMPVEILHNSAEATTVTTSSSQWNNCGIYQDTPADNQVVYRVRTYLDPAVYRCRVVYTKSSNTAIIQLRLVGPETVTGSTIDTYAAVIAYNNVDDENLTISKVGEYRVELITNGKNGSSSDYYAWVQSISLSKQ
jgi:hypothetical protein